MAPPSQSLLLASTPRSGSWLLAEGLRSLGVAGRPEEYFAVDAETSYRQRWNMPAAGTFASFLGRVLTDGTTGNGVFATKLHWLQLCVLLYRLRRLPDRRVHAQRPATDIELLTEYLGPVRIVFLEREDVLMQAVSWHRAMTTNRWWWLAGDHHPRQDDTTGYDFEAIKSLLWLLTDYNASWTNWFQANDLDPLRLTYEEVVADYPNSLRRVVSVLGQAAPAHIPPTGLTRQADDRSARWGSAFQVSWRAQFGSEPPVTSVFQDQ